MTARLCFGAIVFSFVIKFDNDEGEYKIVGWHKIWLTESPSSLQERRKKRNHRTSWALLIVLFVERCGAE
jgi:hypothetical protein